MDSERNGCLNHNNGLKGSGFQNYNNGSVRKGCSNYNNGLKGRWFPKYNNRSVEMAAQIIIIDQREKLPKLK
ncbi:MAG: hypothetical protein LUF92_04715 [Clostridiales bacterium]|nr:hypothetical protein [Clostridiales bacterium]